MGIKTKQEKALELRDLIDKVNILSSELKEEGYTVVFKGGVRGNIREVLVTKVIRL